MSLAILEGELQKSMFELSHCPCSVRLLRNTEEVEASERADWLLEWIDYVKREGVPLREKKLEELEQLVADPEGIRPEKALSRKALFEVYQDLDDHGSSPRHVIHSLSHTDAAVIAAGLDSSKEDSTFWNGLGIDIEHADRKVTEKLSTRLVHPSESEFRLELLDHWVIKEACFKAHPQNQDLVVSDFCVLELDSASNMGRAACLKDIDFRFPFLLQERENLKVAIALSQSIQ